MNSNEKNHLRRCILDQVLRGITQNRIPGYHFTGNFFGTSFDQVDGGKTLVKVVSGPHSTCQSGGLSLGGLALLADVAMASTIHASDNPAQRLVTARIHLEFTGAVANGEIVAASRYRGNFGSGVGRQHLSEVSISQGNNLIGYGTGSFIVVQVPIGTLPLAPFPWRRFDDPPVELLPFDVLNLHERLIYKHAEDVLNNLDSESGSFIHAFLGFAPYRTGNGARGEMPNGPHVTNRVGHLQGGLQLALAALTANAALQGKWKLDSITGTFIRAGLGERFVAESTIVHAGRLTAVIQTQITEAGKLVFESLSTHSQASEQKLKSQAT